MNKKKISWINESTPGYGANLTTRYYMKEAEKRGYEAVYNVADSTINFFVIGMYFARMEKLLQKYLNPRKYIFIEHSVELVQSYNNWLRNWLVPNSFRSFFFSPRHRQHVEDGLPGEYKYLTKSRMRYLVVPVDYNLFKPVEGIERRDNLFILVGFIHPNKGVEDVIKIANVHPQNEYWFIGTLEETPYKKEDFDVYHNVHYKGHVLQKELPRYYTEAKGCYLLPTNGAVESAGRTVFEAVLCGCEPLINANVGNASYQWYQDPNKIIKNIQKSNDLLFKIIEKGINA